MADNITLKTYKGGNVTCGRYSEDGKFQIVGGIVVIDVHVRV